MHRDRNWKIQVFGREHGVPHFHVWTPNAAAVIAIDTLAVLRGAVDAKTLEEVRAWADAHRTPAEERLQVRSQPEIVPLRDFAQLREFCERPVYGCATISVVRVLEMIDAHRSSWQESHSSWILPGDPGVESDTVEI